MFFTVKDMAYYFNNTKGAIRFYEEKGLLNPERDSNGNRQYSFNDLLQLFYLKRYCQFGYSINETNTYFASNNNNKLKDIELIISSKKEETKREIEYYTKRLKWITEYEEKITTYLSGTTQLSIIDIDEFYSVDITDFLTEDKELKRVLKSWINAIPYSKILVKLLSNPNGTFTRTFNIGISKTDAKNLNLEIPSISKVIPKSKVFYTIIESEGDDFKTNCIDKIQKLCTIVEKKGYTIYLPPSYNLLFSNTLNGVSKKIIEVYIPIRF